ncbi:protocadherin alpha-8 isoform X4 [Monodelphis domestica]|uniref:Protocadherin alpha subfamily C, 2 n=1 Tax=Monodelphis domestica TaxID=13616 RepID=K7E2P0_MONDO|nr:protocadherin alpha-8 isoform X4 [Monodelphis domestica]
MLQSKTGINGHQYLPLIHIFELPFGIKHSVFAMMFSQGGILGAQQLLLSLLLHTAWEVGSGQVHYSVLEETKHGTFVGRIAQDLGLEVGELVSKLFRVVSKGRRDYLEVNVQNGILFVNSRIDREELCGRSPVCSIHLELIVDKPLQVFHVEVEIKDINDNAPSFPVKKQKLFISESRMPDARFPLEGASDLDTGTNALLTYRLSANDNFILEVKSKNDQNKLVELVLKKPLDREEVSEYHLILTATDGGKPELSGTLQVLITVLDVNDNAPTFDRSEYEVKILENAASGTLVIKLNASDADEGINREIVYSFNSPASPLINDKFYVNSETGEISIQGHLDFEDVNLYEIRIDATDKGSPPMVGHCTVLVEVLDANDNIPDVVVTSLSLPVREDAPSGTVIALIGVSDRDSGANGLVTCSLSPPGPFTLVSTFRNYYSLVLEGSVDRESVPAYELVVTARDGGLPALWATASVSVVIGDVNDNAPAFEQSLYTVFVKENNPPGSHIFTVSASDPDAQENALVSYSLVERRVGERPLSSYVSVHSESGKVYALQPLDHEELELLHFQVNARDAGFPALGSNVSLQVFVLDENDNSPVVLAPHSSGVPVTELVSQSVAAGHVVAKIRAVDADSGYNAWLSYELQPELGVGRSPFRVGLYTGEISLTRALEESDGPRQTLLVLVKDHGEPVLSTTATVCVSVVESGQKSNTFSGESRISGKSGVGKETALVDVNIYLIIAICSVSSLLVLSVLLYVALRCSAPPQASYGPGKPTLVCSNEMGSWSYSQQRRQICSGEGAGKNDLMAFSPNLPPCPISGERGQKQEALLDSSEKPKQPNPDWRYSASLRAGMHSSVHLEEAGILRAGPGGPDQQWPTVSSATPEPEAGEVSPPVGAGVNSNSWTFKYGPGNPKQPGPGELPDKFIIPGSPAIISIRQEPPNNQIDKSDFITFGKKEETKKKKKKKKGNKTQEKKEKGNSTTDNSDQ